MHLNANPHNAVPPDHAADRYAASRQSLIDDFQLTHKQAALRLTNLWRQQNTIDRQDWDAKRQRENLRAEQEELERQAQAEELQRQQDEEEEQARLDERKKNRSKFLQFADVPMSAAPPVIPSPLALRKLCKGEFCELYFFTNKGLADAQVSSYSTDDEALTLI
ncbi:hypothetical protein J3R83DRAFT_12564 [Lanmaoa asiatica]|nr:hypothetical protein J3R83DRAFT_12564 [Lanmaoa asiatica]